ncbi:unnamed protein product [Acanthoscelides obtectus]|uniref:HTH CENPB-type domain-containing protein n=1 Tax=Acanthoscelides obtectus TaxID=200917 RepID=A0A9P0PKQ5_ACAOB|nr:unnamed protein product [Acanthoscelides obtectus]
MGNRWQYLLPGFTRFCVKKVFLEFANIVAESADTLLKLEQRIPLDLEVFSEGYKINEYTDELSQKGATTRFADPYPFRNAAKKIYQAVQRRLPLMMEPPIRKMFRKGLKEIGVIKVIDGFLNSTMPTKYNRRSTSLRGQWTKEQLLLAIAAVNNNSMGVNEAARHFNVPATTLRRRKKSGNLVVGPQGPSACLGIQNENKIVTHIKKLQAHGFAPTREDVRVMAFKLAEQLQIKHRFNHESGKAGYDWLHSFLSRHPGLSVRKSEGVSLARAQGMRRKEVADYFKLLERVLAENQLFEKHSHIFNVDETGMQLNNKPGFVVAAKGSKNVASITAAEKGETITVISCFSAEGVYIPPTCIMKGKNKKAEYEDGLPPGSKVYMNEKSAYINSALFYLWLKEQFLPRKPVGTVILLLDGHGSHCNNIEMLEFASSNNIILVCLPSHTTQFLQPLDRGFFKSLKMNYYRACNLYIKNNPTRRLTRLQFGELLASAWVKSATVSNAVAAFKATGIVPFNPEAIPDEAFLSETTDVQDNVNNCNNNEQEITTQASILDHPQPGCSKDSLPPPESPPKNNLTPGKMLNNISPIPCTSTPVQQVRKRSKQVASILNSAESITNKKSKQEKHPRKIVTRKVENKNEKTQKGSRRRRKLNLVENTSSESEADVSLHDSSSEGSEDECCRGCNEAYATTKKPDDWLKCIRCLSWYHETCSRYIVSIHHHYTRVGGCDPSFLTPVSADMYGVGLSHINCFNKRIMSLTWRKFNLKLSLKPSFNQAFKTISRDMPTSSSAIILQYHKQYSRLTISHDE